MRIGAGGIFGLAVWAVAAASGSVATAAAEERLIAETPEGWELVTRDATRFVKSFEFVPSPQTAENWSEMISIQVLLGRSDVSPTTAAKGFRQQWESVCEHFRGDEPELVWEKDYLATSLLVECREPKPDNPGLQPLEARMLKVVQGRDSLYLVQRAWRDRRNGLGNRWFAPDTRAEWEAYMRAVEVCDSRIRQQPCRALEPPHAATGQ